MRDNSLGKWIKLVSLVLFTGVVLFATFLHFIEFAVGSMLGSDSSTHFDVIDIRLFNPWGYVLSFVFGILAIGLFLQIVLGKKVNRRLMAGYIVSAGVMVLLLSTALLPTKLKEVYIGGMTEASCETGGSIFPWGFQGEVGNISYEQRCRELHGSCSGFSSKSGQVRCFSLNKEKYNSSSDCVGMPDRCFEYVEHKTGVRACLESKNNWILFRECVFEATDLSIGSANQVKMTKYAEDETGLLLMYACRDSYDDVQQAVCTYDLAVRADVQAACNRIADDLPELTEVCRQHVEQVK